MRYIVLFLMTFWFVTCQEKTTQPNDQYDSLLFNRVGGGNLEFTVYPIIGSSLFQTVVTSLSYRDTTINMILSRDNGKSTTFYVLTQTLNGQNEITGDFKQDTLTLAGTWVILYMVKDCNLIEITNTELRNILLDLEYIVRAKL